MPTTVLGMFAKHWRPGEVKTRLALAIGPEGAARLQRAFVETLLLRMAGIAEQSALVYTPAEREGEFAALVKECARRQSSPLAPREEIISRSEMSTRASWSLQPQAAGDLGCRMQQFFEQSLAAGAERVVLIGSDSPTVPSEFVHQAFDELRRQALVLGPSEDGGYYLIGLSRVGSAVRTDVSFADGEPQARSGPHSGPYRLRPIFTDMPWSTPQVWPETMRRLDRQGYSYAILPAWYDVDEMADLERLRAELSSATDDASLRSLKQLLGEIVAQ
jgi:glycosyltransferase A (GT-A) superfamily protein (DUF2064 family)